MDYETADMIRRRYVGAPWGSGNGNNSSTAIARHEETSKKREIKQGAIANELIIKMGEESKNLQEKCDTLEKEKTKLQKDYNDLLREKEYLAEEKNALLRINEDLSEENDKLSKQKYHELEELESERLLLFGERNQLSGTIERLSKQNDEMWKQNADIFHRNTKLENVNSRYTMTDILDGFRHLYANNWADIWEEGEDDCNTHSRLSTLMKKTYRQCTMIADKQIRTFCGLGETDKLPTKDDNKELYDMRRKQNVDDPKRKKIVNEITATLFMEEDFQHYTNENPKITTEIREFFDKFADKCWLLAIAEEEIIVDFEVIGKQYADVKERFKIYSGGNTVSGPETCMVMTLVWPCIRKADGEVLMKGDVSVGVLEETSL